MWCYTFLLKLLTTGPRPAAKNIPNLGTHLKHLRCKKCVNIGLLFATRPMNDLDSPLFLLSLTVDIKCEFINSVTLPPVFALPPPTKALVPVRPLHLFIRLPTAPTKADPLPSFLLIKNTTTRLETLLARSQLTSCRTHLDSLPLFTNTRLKNVN